MVRFSVNDHAFKAACTRRVMLPHHINPLEAEYHHFPQIFQPPQVDAGEPELGEEEAEYSQVLNCVMMEDVDGLHTFRECEYYRITPNSEDLEDDMEDDSDGEEIIEDEANAITTNSEELEDVLEDDPDDSEEFMEDEANAITPNSEELEDFLEDDSDGEEIMEDEANAITPNSEDLEDVLEDEEEMMEDEANAGVDPDDPDE